jgi:hypothetical protein
MGYFMKIENVRTAETNLNRLISDLPRSGSVIIYQKRKTMCRADANNGRHRPGGTGAFSE